MNNKIFFSASIMCGDALNYSKVLDELIENKIDFVHADIMDNHFVPNLMLPMEVLNRLHQYGDIPFDFHLMVDDPKSIIDKLDIKKGDIISVHYECDIDHLSLFKYIKDKGAKVSLAINPDTDVKVISKYLDYLDMVLIMAVYPGFSGQKMVPTTFSRLEEAKKLCEGRNILIEVDGNCSFDNIPKMVSSGASILVLGSSSLFAKGYSIKEAKEKILENVSNYTV